MEAIRTPSSALPLMANPFVRTAGQLMFAWCLVGIELEVLTSCEKMKLDNKRIGKSLENHRKLDEIRRFHKKNLKRGMMCIAT